MTLDQMKNKANQLRKDKKYEEAIDLYTQIIEQSGEEVSIWDEWGLAYCLYKTEDFKQSLEYCRKVYQKDPSFDAVYSVYTWDLYYLEIKKTNVTDDAKYFKALNEILGIVDQEEEYTPYTLAIFKATDYLLKKKEVDYEKVINYLLMVKPDLLEDKKAKYKDKRGVSIDIPSQKEKYYSSLCKALKNTRRYNECIEQCDLALKDLQDKGEKNFIWYMRNKALCLKELQKKKEALQVFMEILKVKKDWNIFFDLAELHFDLSDFKTALQYSIECAMMKIDDASKIKNLLLLIDILESMNLKEEVAYHFKLIQLIHEQNKWKMTKELKIKMSQYSNPPQNLSNIDALVNHLSQYWNQIKYDQHEKSKGFISKIFPHNKYGFIQSKKNSYYFHRRDFKGTDEQFAEGTYVSFCLVDSIDPKNNKAVKNAVLVVPEANKKKYKED